MNLKRVWWAKLGAASLLAMSAAAAQAVPLVFTLTGGYSATWTMSSTPTPDAAASGAGFTLFDIAGTFPGALLGLVDLTFFNAALDGGMAIDDFYGGSTLLVTDGPQLYTGDEETAPTFHTGSFTMTEFGGNTRYTLTISNVAVAPVPEPASVASMLAGLGLIGAAMRRRKAKAREAVATA